MEPEARLAAAQAERARQHRLSPSEPLRDAKDAAAFVHDRLIVTETGHAGVPVLAHAIAGRELRGSWMASPEVYVIYDLLNELAELGLEWVSLLDGKTTVLDPSLGPAVQRVASDPERRARLIAQLPPLPARLLAQAEAEGQVRMDWTGVPAKEGRAARTLLTRHLLVVSGSVHTETGAHAAYIAPWASSGLARRHAKAAARLGLEEAMDGLVTAALRSAVVVPERDARKWADFAPDRLAGMVADGRAERLVVAPRQAWLLPG